jgi:hypothetical protein
MTALHAIYNQNGSLVSKLGGKRKNGLDTVAAVETGQYFENSEISVLGRTASAESHLREDATSVQADLSLPTPTEDIQVRRLCTYCHACAYSGAPASVYSA